MQAPLWEISICQPAFQPQVVSLKETESFNVSRIEEGRCMWLRANVAFLIVNSRNTTLWLLSQKLVSFLFYIRDETILTTHTNSSFCGFDSASCRRSRLNLRKQNKSLLRFLKIWNRLMKVSSWELRNSYWMFWSRVIIKMLSTINLILKFFKLC